MRIIRVINKVKYLAFGAAVAALLASCNSGSGSSSASAFNPADSLHLAGYMLGRDMGRSVMDMRDNGAEFDKGAFLLALKEALDSVPSQLSDSALKVVDERFKRDLGLKRREKRIKLEEDNLKIANAFLDENKSKEGVKVTESGLQYVVLKEGTGPKPKLKDKVKVHYHGTMQDGTVFDSSVDRGAPATFPVDGVIAGWMEILQIMPVGSKYKIVVPPELGYGRRGARPPIGPNAVLVFDIELLEIEK
jgi:FKBP-type peptidyl-prolyl cis-trans isomerase